MKKFLPMIAILVLLTGGVQQDLNARDAVVAKSSTSNDFKDLPNQHEPRINDELPLTKAIEPNGKLPFKAILRCLAYPWNLMNSCCDYLCNVDVYENPLEQAIFDDDIEEVQRLLEKGVRSPQAIDVSFTWGNYEAVELLLNARVEISLDCKKKILHTLLSDALLDMYVFDLENHILDKPLRYHASDDVDRIKIITFIKKDSQKKENFINWSKINKSLVVLAAREYPELRPALFRTESVEDSESAYRTALFRYEIDRNYYIERVAGTIDFELNRLELNNSSKDHGKSKKDDVKPILLSSEVPKDVSGSQLRLRSHRVGRRRVQRDHIAQMKATSEAAAAKLLQENATV